MWKKPMKAQCPVFHYDHAIGLSSPWQTVNYSRFNTKISSTCDTEKSICYRLRVNPTPLPGDVIIGYDASFNSHHWFSWIMVPWLMITIFFIKKIMSVSYTQLLLLVTTSQSKWVAWNPLSSAVLPLTFLWLSYTNVNILHGCSIH